MVVEEFNWVLSIAVFLPVMSAIITLLFLSGKAARGFAVIVTLTELLITSYIFLAYRNKPNGYQMADHITGWIPVESFKVDYYLAVDGISAPLVLLSGILGIVAVFASWNIKHRMKEHFMWLLALQGAVLGVFTALDFFLFFLFWELELIPMFFLISIWGSGRKEYSAMTFLIFTLLRSACMLVGILFLYSSLGLFAMTRMRDG